MHIHIHIYSSKNREILRNFAFADFQQNARNTTGTSGYCTRMFFSQLPYICIYFSNFRLKPRTSNRYCCFISINRQTHSIQSLSSTHENFPLKDLSLYPVLLKNSQQILFMLSSINIKPSADMFISLIQPNYLNHNKHRQQL